MREPGSLEGPGRYQTSFQLSPELFEYMYVLTSDLGISRTDVVEHAIRELARRLVREHRLSEEVYQSLLDPPTPRRSYHVPSATATVCPVPTY